MQTNSEFIRFEKKYKTGSWLFVLSAGLVIVGLTLSDLSLGLAALFVSIYLLLMVIAVLLYVLLLTK